MNDDELQCFLEWSRNQQPFDQLSDDWKVWAKGIIQSAKVDVDHIKPNDAVLYLCQIMRVFKELRKGISEDVFRGKFISGLVLSGFPPQKDASFFFLRALEEAQKSGYITEEKVDLWQPGMTSGSGWTCFYELTIAGQRLADSAEITTTCGDLSSNETDQPAISSGTPIRWYLFFRGSASSRLIDGERDDDLDKDDILQLQEWHLFDYIDDLTAEEISILFKVLDADYQGILAEDDGPLLNGEIQGSLYEFKAVCEQDAKKDQVEWIRLHRKWSDLDRGYNAFYEFDSFNKGWTIEITTEHNLWESSRKTAELIRSTRCSATVKNKPNQPNTVAQHPDLAKPVSDLETPASNSTSSTKGASQPSLTAGLATIIMGCKALQILAQIRLFYPRAISDEETTEIHRQLTDAIEFWLSLEGDTVKGCRDVYVRPTPKELLNDETFVLMTTVAMIATNSDQPELEGRLDKIFQQSQIMAVDPVQSIIKRLLDSMIFDCREVEPTVGPEYTNPQRALYLLGEYWSVLRSAAITASQEMMYHVPHPLTPMLVNLRERFKGCFNAIGSINGVEDTKDTIERFLACLLEGDTIALQACEEYFNEQLAKTEVFIQEAKLLIGRKTFDLTFAEEAFLKMAREGVKLYEQDTQAQEKAVYKYLNGPQFSEIKNARRTAAKPDAVKQVNIDNTAEPEQTKVEKTNLQSDTDQNARLSHTELASKYHLDPEAVRKRLDRWRRKNIDGWDEVTERKSRKSKYLYCLSSVKQILENMASGQMSGERPAK